MKRRSYPFDFIRWAESLQCSIDGIRFYRSAAAVRLWSADKRAIGIAHNVEAARIAWGLLNRTIARLLAFETLNPES